jgi:hypothetical protein
MLYTLDALIWKDLNCGQCSGCQPVVSLGIYAGSDWGFLDLLHTVDVVSFAFLGVFLNSERAGWSWAVLSRSCYDGIFGQLQWRAYQSSPRHNRDAKLINDIFVYASTVHTWTDSLLALLLRGTSLVNSYQLSNVTLNRWKLPTRKPLLFMGIVGL